MRKLIARVFDYSLDGLIAAEDTESFQYCQDLPDDPAEDAAGREFYVGADLHIMGRAARLFEDAGKSRQLELVSSIAFSRGLQLDYRRRR